MNSEVIYALLFTVATVFTLAVVQSWLGYPGEVRIPDVISALASAIIFVLVLWYGERIYNAVSQEFGEREVQLGIALSMVGIGVLVHRFRTANLAWYALVEIAFGVSSAFVISQGLSTSGRLLPQMTALVGCAYVVGRGLENREKSRAMSSSMAAIAATSPK